jgi:hypothetical protein
MAEPDKHDHHHPHGHDHDHGGRKAALASGPRPSWLLHSAAQRLLGVLLLAILLLAAMLWATSTQG